MISRRLSECRYSPNSRNVAWTTGNRVRRNAPHFRNAKKGDERIYFRIVPSCISIVMGRHHESGRFSISTDDNLISVSKCFSLGKGSQRASSFFLGHQFVTRQRASSAAWCPQNRDIWVAFGSELLQRTRICRPSYPSTMLKRLWSTATRHKQHEFLGLSCQLVSREGSLESRLMSSDRQWLPRRDLSFFLANFPS